MKQRHIITTIAGFAIAVILWIVLIAPAMDRTDRLIAEINEADRKLADFSSTMLEAPEFFKLYQDVLNRKKEIASKLYTKEDLIRLFGDLDNKAKKYNLQITEITPSISELLLLNKRIPSDSEPQMLHMSIFLKGGLIQTGKFLRDMENENFYQGLDHFRFANTNLKWAESDIKFSFKAVLGTIKGN